MNNQFDVAATLYLHSFESTEIAKQVKNINQFNNKIVHYSIDGFIYSKNKRICKWFAHHDKWKYLWAPAVNINYVESIYYKLIKRRLKFIKKRRLIINKIQKTKPFFSASEKKVWLAISKHDRYGYVIYKFSNNNYGLSWSYNYLKSVSSRINFELGTEFHRYEALLDRRNLYKIELLLNNLIISKIKNSIPEMSERPQYKYIEDKIFEVTINGRNYYYKGSNGGSPYYKIEEVISIASSSAGDIFNKIET